MVLVFLFDFHALLGLLYLIIMELKPCGLPHDDQEARKLIQLVEKITMQQGEAQPMWMTDKLSLRPLPRCRMP
jgi:hypothetical protein